MTEDRLSQAQAHIDAIKAKAEDDLAALREAAASAKERVQTGTSELRSRSDPQAESAPAGPSDDRPTIELNVPGEFSFGDFDPGAPTTPAENIIESEENAPAVRFDPDIDVSTDDDGIPTWEDPA